MSQAAREEEEHEATHAHTSTGQHERKHAATALRTQLPPSFCAGPDLGPARGVAVVTRPGKGKREARETAEFG